MKKLWMILLMCVVGAVLLTGCASNADTLASPTPGATELMPSQSPNATDGMGTSPSPGTLMSPDESSAPALGADAQAGPATLEESRQASGDMEEALERLTEVDEAHVVAIGDLALVGVTFDDQYQGGLDERIKKMVLARVQTVNKGVTKVAVTNDKAGVSAVDQLAQAMESGSSLSAIESQAKELSDTISVYPE